MARGVNKVIIVGNLGADPETRYTQSGTAITSLRLATSEAWTDKQSGEKQERTEWHRVKLFGKLAEIAGEYLAKGRQVYIEGSLRTDKYTDKDGIERYSTDIIANEMQMLGGNPNGDGGQQRQGGGQQQRGGGGGGQRGGGDYAGNSGGGDRQRGYEQGDQGYGRDAGQGQGSARDRARQATEGTQRMNQQRSAPPTNEGFDDDDIPF